MVYSGEKIINTLLVIYDDYIIKKKKDDCIYY